MSTRHSTTPNRNAFTLIEILVVLAIASLLTAISVGGFKAMRDGNKRTSCQTNLVQIYQACRMYAADADGNFPPFATIASGSMSPPTCPISANSNLGTGLWALYTFPNGDFDKPLENQPIERYIRSSKILHCPDDFSHRSLFSSGSSLYDLEYLSYQTCDNGVPTYASVRNSTNTNSSTMPWPRQLAHFNGPSLVTRLPADSTVVTWCQWHRNGRDFDNVLFYDGSVQILPRSQVNPGDAIPPTTAAMSTLTDWRRKPKDPQ